ncbi:MAG: M15 family metallopeptidase [Verrucomicrobiae bacterium]|nr:M15 family metallopeptidase [Verrucomicrobiae bacterium]MCB1086469.1 M15 family metallopeptidase [Verrucomicrobiae bacterium]
MSAIFLSGCASGTNPGRDEDVIAKARRYGLVHVPPKIPGIRVDLRYRTSENATRRPLYPQNMPCLLHPSAVEKLSAAQRILSAQGYGLLILDAWRPPESHAALWRAVRDPRWVVPPSDGLSMHCYGLAVDVTLVNASGIPQRMPSAYDEFSDRARRDYAGPDPEIRRNVTVLQQAMIQAGFRSIPDEWWHFDVPGKTRATRVKATDLGIKLPQ